MGWEHALNALEKVSLRDTGCFCWFSVMQITLTLKLEKGTVKNGLLAKDKKRNF